MGVTRRPGGWRLVGQREREAERWLACASGNGGTALMGRSGRVGVGERDASQSEASLRSNCNGQG